VFRPEAIAQPVPESREATVPAADLPFRPGPGQRSPAWSPPRPERQASRAVAVRFGEQELAHVKVAPLEPELCGRHVQPPRSRDFLARRGQRRIPVRFQPRNPSGERQRVVRTQRLDVDELEASRPSGGNRCLDGDELPVREDVPIDEVAR